MLRIFKNTAEMFLVLAVWCFQIQQKSYLDMVREVHRWLATNPDTLGKKLSWRLDRICQLIERTHDSALQTEENVLNEAVEGISQQLESSTIRERDLLDQMVEVMNLPWTTNAFNNTTRDALRKALLIPSEIEALQEFGKNLYCGICRVPLVKGEMCTLTEGTNSYGKKFGLVFACHKCVRPTVVQPDCCEKKVPLNRKLRNSLGGTILCDEHKDMDQVPRSLSSLGETLRNLNNDILTFTADRVDGNITITPNPMHEPLPTHETVRLVDDETIRRLFHTPARPQADQRVRNLAAQVNTWIEEDFHDDID